MKKYLLISIILISLLLTGCGIYNLNQFIIPDDLEFIKVVEQLDTPEKIANYMQENYTYQVHNFYAPDPYTLWQIKEGDCNDFATFGMFVANYHGYETWKIIIVFENTIISHCIAVYQEDTLSMTTNRYYHAGFNFFEEIVNIYYGKWSKYYVYDYDGNLVEKGER